MKARIEGANKQKGLYVFCCDGDYGYFELLESEDLNVGDVLIGDFSSLGGTSVRLVGSKELIDIFIEDYCSLEYAISVIHGN